MDEREKKFGKAMVEIYNTAKRDLGYNATRFLQLISSAIGPVQAAKRLISKEGGTYGFEVLREHNRLDLTVEAHVLKPEFMDLFTEEEKEICKKRLEELGYTVD